MQQRLFIHLPNLRISYFDNQKDAMPIVFLHGHFSCAHTFAHIANRFDDRYRTICIDQRGHGWSEHSQDYSREAYINDILDIFNTLGLSRVIVAGHSLGGVNAFQFAAKYPQYVKALIIEDIGTRIDCDMSSFLQWPARFSSIRELKEHFRQYKMGDNTYFMESVSEYEDGWGFRFDYRDIVCSQQHLNGDYSDDWSKITCPVLLMHGQNSWAFSKENAIEMTQNKQNVELVEFEKCGHVLHDENPQKYIHEVTAFLNRLQ